MTYLTYIERNQEMNDIHVNLPCNPNELERFLDETSVPLSDDEMQAMSAYFQFTNNSLCYIIDS